MSSLTSLPLQISNPLFDNNFTMNELAGAGEGDLEAVVRGCTNGFSTSFSSPLSSTTDTIQQDFVFSSNFPDFFDQTSSVLDELEQLYKPFYPMLNLNPISPQTSTNLSSISNSVSSREVREPRKETGTDQSPVLVGANSTTAPAVKYKRRKTQHKRVELQVTAEGLSSDVWAWRKYGQKPIKGSPYPRSYYRCSSKKGCLARKQVERSQSDPKMFIITYTAEHCHSQPTRRSSLAGTTRLKFSTPKGSTTANDLNPPIPKDSSSSPISSAAEQSSDSPPTPLSDLATRELQEFSELQPMNKKSIEEEKQDDQEMDIGNEHINNGLVMCDTIWSDDFFLGYDELDRLPFDLPYNGFLDEQFPMAFP